MALSIHFGLPDIISDKHAAPSLDVVLVNSKTQAKPVKANVLAQANLDGGGNTDENRRAKTPLPVLKETESGADAKHAEQRVQELEAQQLRMMTQLRASEKRDPCRATESRVRDGECRSPSYRARNSPPAPSRSRAWRRRSRAILDEYNQRPRKTFIGARAEEYRFAQYVEDWRLKVERIGNLNYPEGARGRVYGSLVLSVSIKSDGSLDRSKCSVPPDNRFSTERPSAS